MYIEFDPSFIHFPLTEDESEEAPSITVALLILLFCKSKSDFILEGSNIILIAMNMMANIISRGLSFAIAIIVVMCAICVPKLGLASLWAPLLGLLVAHCLF